jgi:hypothetical protein
VKGIAFPSARDSQIVHQDNNTLGGTKQSVNGPGEKIWEKFPSILQGTYFGESKPTWFPATLSPPVFRFAQNSLGR